MGLFLCLTECLSLQEWCIGKNNVFSAICMHLNILIQGSHTPFWEWGRGPLNYLSVLWEKREKEASVIIEYNKLENKKKIGIFLSGIGKKTYFLALGMGPNGDQEPCNIDKNGKNILKGLFLHVTTLHIWPNRTWKRHIPCWQRHTQ